MSSSEEKRGLTHSFRSQTGYGTAAISASSKKPVPKTRKFISKKVSRTDTLIGIALKYGVTVQDLKKDNRLWTNDSLFLRETLLIPLRPENEGVLDPDDVIVSLEGNPPSASTPSPSASHHQHKNGNTSSISPSSSSSSSSSAVLEVESVSHSTDHNINNQLSTTKSSTSAPSSSSSSSSSSRPSPSSSTPGEIPSSVSSPRGCQNGIRQEASGKEGAGGGPLDFFSKYDVTIAKLKGDVAKMESTHLNDSPFLQENPMALPPSPRSYPRTNRRWSSPTSRAPHHVRRTSSSPTRTDEDPDGSLRPLRSRHESPVLVIRSRTNSKLVKSTLERSKKASDDLFEL